MGKMVENMTSGLEEFRRINQEVINMYKLDTVDSILGSVAALRSVIREDITKSMLESVKSMQTVINNSVLSQTLDVTRSIKKILPVIDCTWKIPDINWSWMNERIEAIKEFDETEAEELLTEDICEELEESAQETIISGISQEGLVDKFSEWKKRNPIFAWAFLTLINALWQILIVVAGAWLSGVILKPSNVYEEPKSTSNIVINVNVEQDVTIVNEAPYYYGIIYGNPETGEEKIGYIYKPNIRILEE